MHTKNCIVCSKQAVRWSGHIHTEIGTIISGWCEYHTDSQRPLSVKCTSINKFSCGGDFKLEEIETIEEINSETLKKHFKSQEFGDMIDAQCSPNHPKNKR